jgi:hypothetical protein
VNPGSQGAGWNEKSGLLAPMRAMDMSLGRTAKFLMSLQLQPAMQIPVK